MTARRRQSGCGIGAGRRRRILAPRISMYKTLAVQSNPLDVSPDNGSISIMVLAHSENCSDIGSIFTGQNRGTLKRIWLYIQIVTNPRTMSE